MAQLQAGAADALRMYTLEEMLMPDEVLLGNTNAILPISFVFLNPQNHFPIIGLAGAHGTQPPRAACVTVIRHWLTLCAGMALLFDGFNDYLRIAHEEIAFPSQVLRVAMLRRQRFCKFCAVHLLLGGVSKQCLQLGPVAEVHEQVWCMPCSLPSSQLPPPLAALTPAPRRPLQTVLTMMAPDGFREFEISNTDNLVFFRGVNQSAPTGVSVNDGEWHHLAVSIRIDAENWAISLFVDTALVAQRTLPTYKEIAAGT
jgi:hypothetical protein